MQENKELREQLKKVPERSVVNGHAWHAMFDPHHLLGARARFILVGQPRRLYFLQKRTDAKGFQVRC